MKEYPINLKDHEVRAILDGRKTQTRRPIKSQPPHGSPMCPAVLTTDCDSPSYLSIVCDEYDDFLIPKCPYGQPGDRLWVRETWCCKLDDGEYVYDSNGNHVFLYRADGQDVIKDDGNGGQEFRKDGTEASPWSPSIHMPRWASRITLEVKSLWVQRVQEISEEDAKAEGVDPTKPIYGDCGGCLHEGHKDAFKNLWNSTYAKRNLGWDVNPWIGVIEFKKV